MRCLCTSCKTHPKHAEAQRCQSDPQCEVTCFRRSPEPSWLGVLVGEAYRVPQVQATFDCAAYDGCRGCPTCQPLPQWAKEKYGEP